MVAFHFLSEKKYGITRIVDIFGKILVMPALCCGFCSVSLLDSASTLPENVHLICGKCKTDCDYYLTHHQHSTEDGTGLSQKDFMQSTEEPKVNGTDKVSEEVVEQVCRKIPEILVPICEASTSEAHDHLRNRKSLIVSGLAEMEGDQDLAPFLNWTLLPALGIPPQFSVAYAYRLGQKPRDQSPRFCKCWEISLTLHAL